jgi:hypothetical protein
MSTFINDQISLEITLIYVVEIKYLECIVIFSNKITSLLLGAQKCNKIKTHVKQELATLTEHPSLLLGL